MKATAKQKKKQHLTNFLKIKYELWWIAKMMLMKFSFIFKYRCDYRYANSQNYLIYCLSSSNIFSILNERDEQQYIKYKSQFFCKWNTLKCSIVFSSVQLAKHIMPFIWIFLSSLLHFM